MTAALTTAHQTGATDMFNVKTRPREDTDIAGVLPEEMEKLRCIFETVATVERVVLYGSRAQGTHRAGSDIDLTLQGNHITTQQLLEICSEVDDLLLPYEVDLSIFDHIDNKALIDHINRVGKTIFNRR